ncbi:hypothetical protein WKT22_05164 [Candidatus Lokiarchaeum ossiferum]
MINPIGLIESTNLIRAGEILRGNHAELNYLPRTDDGCF